MTTEKELHHRSGSTCELCGDTNALLVYAVTPASPNVDTNVLICHTCFEQLENPAKADLNHWRCLNNSMWSTVPAVQVMVWRILNSRRHAGWPQDLLDMLYLDDETLTWAKTGISDSEVETDEKIIHKDCNGAVLQAGDSVVLIKDLDVKGGGFTAKRGTMVRGIALVENNGGQIEGKVNGQHIVILTQFVKRS